MNNTLYMTDYGDWVELRKSKETKPVWMGQIDGTVLMVILEAIGFNVDYTSYK